MGAFRSLVILAAGAAIGGAALLAYRVSQETGKPFQEALGDVPGEAQALFTDLRSKASEALQRGRDMYVDKQQDIADAVQADC